MPHGSPPITANLAGANHGEFVTVGHNVTYQYGISLHNMGTYYRAFLPGTSLNICYRLAYPHEQFNCPTADSDVQESVGVAEADEAGTEESDISPDAFVPPDPDVADWEEELDQPSVECPNIGRSYNGLNMFADRLQQRVGLFVPQDENGIQMLQSWGNSLKLAAPNFQGLGLTEPPPEYSVIKMDPVRYMLGKYWTTPWANENGAPQFMSSLLPSYSDAKEDFAGFKNTSAEFAMAVYDPQSELFGSPQKMFHQFTWSSKKWNTSGFSDPNDTRPWYSQLLRLKTAPVIKMSPEKEMENAINVLKTIQTRIEQLNAWQGDISQDAGRYKEDHVFNLPIPFSNKEYLASPQENPLILDIKPEYNFYNKKYESEIDRFGASISLLPSLLLTIIEQMGLDNDPKTFSLKALPEYLEPWAAQITRLANKHRDFITLNGGILDVFLDIFLTDEKKIKIGEKDKQNYFDAWANAADKYQGTGPLKDLADIYKNQILFPRGGIPESTKNRLKKFFPMVANLQLIPIPPAPFFDADTDPTSIDFDAAAFNSEPGLVEMLTKPPDPALPMWYAFLKLFMDGEDSSDVPTSSIRHKLKSGSDERYLTPDLQEYDFYTFLEKLDPEAIMSAYATGDNTKGLFYLRDNDEVKASIIIPQSDDPKLFEALSAAHPPVSDDATPMEKVAIWADWANRMQVSMEHIKTKFNQLVQKRTRTYEEILAGMTACTEVIYWKISKYFADSDGNATGEALQNFYYLNKPNIAEIKLPDTQVKYGKAFVYKVYAITAVFGTEYEHIPIKNTVKTVGGIVTLEDLETYKKFLFPYTHMVTAADNNPGLFDLPYKHIDIPDKGTYGFIKPDRNIYWPEDPLLIDPHTGVAPAAPLVGENVPLAWNNMFFEQHTAGHTDWGDWVPMSASSKAWQVTGPFIEFLTKHSNALVDTSNAYSSFAQRMDQFTPVEILGGIQGHWALSPDPKVELKNFTLDLKVISRPSVKIIEVPYGEVHTIMVDSPPLPPVIRFTPYMGVNDRFLFSFDSGTGRIEESPIVLLPEDEQAIEKQVIAQGADFPPVLVYETDDPPMHYEIFRIDPPTTESEMLANQTSQYYPPVSYTSFRNNSVYKKVPTNGDFSTTMLESVEPNKKYYYTFRAKDVHENISNPSSMYKVELVDDSGAVYLLVETYRPPVPERTNTKSMRKYFSVVPTLEQTIVNKKPGSSEEEVSNHSLGIANESIFDDSKVFKVRLTSKQTGRKIDFNINFNNTQHK